MCKAAGVITLAQYQLAICRQGMDFIKLTEAFTVA